MTFADETANALYATVCERPECDTARLILADRLDEVGDRDLAEFIRVGCRIAAINAGIQSDEDCGQPGCYECDARRPLLAREAELREAHPEWRKCPCPACGGFSVAVETCPTCGGTGDLFASRWIGVKERTRLEYRTVTLSRGFPASVECAAADVWREERRDETAHIGGHRYPTSRIVTVPTEWARAVVRHTPVTRFVVTDFVPAESARHGGWWRWYAGEARDEVPQVVFDLLVGEYPSDWRGAALVPYWRSGAAARDALAVALGKWARAAAYPAVPGG